MSLNKVFLVGYVGREPDVRYIDNGMAVAEVRLATTERGYTLPNGTQVPERTEWHDLVFSRGLAQTVERHVRKGDKIFVEGKLQKHSFRDRMGKQREIVEIMVERLELMYKPSAFQGYRENVPRPAPDNSRDRKQDENPLPF